MKWAALAGGLAFYVSVLTHAALMLYLLEHDLKTFWLYLPPLPRGVELFVQVEEDEVPLRHLIGEEAGKGFGSHQSRGADLLYAPRGPSDQAWLSRDPAGSGALVGEPTLSTMLSRESLNAMDGPIGVAPTGTLVSPAIGPPAQLMDLAAASAPEPIAAGSIDDRPPSTQPANESVAIARSAQPSFQTNDHVTTARSHSVGPVAADPAPESDSESDAFARIGSVQFKNGRLDVRLGRKVKTVKPQFTIKGGLDRISIVNPVTVVMVTIRDTGKVSDVKVLRSSGSNELDLPWVLAVYKWWFEPAKDPAGKPTTDIVQLTLGVIEREF
jgi:TonB family protein